MSETWHRTLVGTVIIIIGLGLLEMALNRTPMDRPFPEIAAPAEESTDRWQDYLDSEGRVLRIDGGSAVPAAARELSSR